MKKQIIVHISLWFLTAFSQLVQAESAVSGKSVVTITQNDDTGNEDTGSIDEIATELHTLDTVDNTTSGNWLLKRAWWEKTEDIYEQLKECVSSIMAMRANFVSQRNESDRALDILFSEVGVEQGVLLDTVSYAKDLMDKLKVQGMLTPQEKSFAEKLAGKERELEQLKIDIKGIDGIDNKIDEALDVFFAQIDTCNKYEHKAWENFKDIARELNDKEARKLYYNTETLFKDVKNIKQYLENDFKQYFNSLLQKAKEHTQKISGQINALKAEGIDIKKESQLLEKESSEAEKNKIKDKAAAQEKKKLEDAEKKHKAEMLKANSLYSITGAAQKLWGHVQASFVYFEVVTIPVKQFFSAVYSKVEHSLHTGYDLVLNLLNIKTTKAAITSKDQKKPTAPEVKSPDKKINSVSTADHSAEKKVVENKKVAQASSVVRPEVVDKKIEIAPKVQKTGAQPIKGKVVQSDAQDLNKSINYYEKPVTNTNDSDLSYYGIEPKK